jgi:hypothetical protein
MLRYRSEPNSKRDALLKSVSVTTRGTNSELTILKTQVADLRFLDFFPTQEAQRYKQMNSNGGLTWLHRGHNAPDRLGTREI